MNELLSRWSAPPTYTQVWLSACFAPEFFFLIFFASSSCSLERRCSIMVKVSCLSCLESNDLQVPFSHVYIFSYSLCIMCARAYSVWLSLCWSLHTIVCPWSIEAYRKEYSLHVPIHMGIFMWNNIKIEVNWLLFFLSQFKFWFPISLSIRVAQPLTT